jgi:hypothetical protein
MQRISVAVVFLLSAVASAQPSTSAPTTSAWNPKDFPISFWCAPDGENTNLERYQQVKDAGFTFVMPPCSGATVENNHKILDLCKQVGLKAFIQDSRVVLAGKGKGKVEDVDAAVKEYASHPALAGYMVDDEPLASAFPQLAAVVNRLREKDPAHVAFINLFPNIVAPNLLIAKSYDDYLRRFVQTVKPFTLSYDHYSLQKKGDDKLFIANLAAARKVALDEHVPFWNIVQVTEWGSMRNLTQGEIEYQAMQSLAMGAKGLLWFTYWTPKGDHSQAWKHAMIDADDKPTEHYQMVKQTNARLLAIGNELLHATSAGYFQTGTVPPGGLAPTKDAPVTIEGDAPPMTVGWFDGPDGERLILFASGDYKEAIDFDATINGSKVERFDVKTRAWTEAETKAKLHLEPGSAALYRTQRD